MEDYLAESGQVYKCPILATLPYSPKVKFDEDAYSAALIKIGQLNEKVKSIPEYAATVAGLFPLQNCLIHKN